MDENIAGMDVAVGAVAALAPGQRWSLARKREVVLRLMQGEPVEGLSRRLGLPVYKLSGANAGSLGSTPGCASATTIRMSASSPRRIVASVR